MEPVYFRHWPADMPRSLPPADRTLHDMLDATARRFPDKQCKAILYTCMDQRRLEATPVHEFVDRLVI